MAASATCLFLLSILVAATTAVAAASDEDGKASHAPAAGVVDGGRTDDVGRNKEVESLGRFAVAKHNHFLRHGGTANSASDLVPVKLAFGRVVAAQKQVVSGVAYYLKVIARDPTSGGDRPFDAVVVVKAWLKSKELVSFTPSPK
ncbi:hypothetical protein ABZP36_007434 [Zizania latifolia]